MTLGTAVVGRLVHVVSGTVTVLEACQLSRQEVERRGEAARPLPRANMKQVPSNLRRRTCDDFHHPDDDADINININVGPFLEARFVSSLLEVTRTREERRNSGHSRRQRRGKKND